MAKSNTRATADEAKHVIVAKLMELGVRRIFERLDSRVVLLDCSIDGKSTTVRFKSKRSGDWQTSTDIGQGFGPKVDFWIFLQFGNENSNDRFYIVPNDWLRRDVAREHAEYLRQHGGKRAITPDSTHHKISNDRLSQWADRWDLLGI